MAKNNSDSNKAMRFDNEDRIKELKPEYLLKNVIGVKPGMICIDMGSGTGVFSLPMARLVGDRGRILAVDNNLSMIDHLKNKNPPPNLRIIHANVFDTGLSDSMADFCLLSFILHEVKEPGKLLEETYRLLKDNGRVCVIEWKTGVTPHGPPERIRISEESLKGLFSQAGFSDFKYTDWSVNHYVATGNKYKGGFVL